MTLPSDTHPGWRKLEAAIDASPGDGVAAVIDRLPLRLIDAVKLLAAGESLSGRGMTNGDWAALNQFDIVRVDGTRYVLSAFGRRVATKLVPKVITLPNGKQCTLGEYVRSWKELKRLPATMMVKGWSNFPESVAWILAAIRYGVNDRVNIRGGVVLGRDMSYARVMRNLQRTVKVNCRWCGNRLAEYQPLHSRFCNADCQREF